jgi:hypothetical protein
MGFHAMIVDNLKVPFEASVLGVDVTVEDREDFGPAPAGMSRAIVRYEKLRLDSASHRFLREKRRKPWIRVSSSLLTCQQRLSRTKCAEASWPGSQLAYTPAMLRPIPLPWSLVSGTRSSAGCFHTQSSRIARRQRVGRSGAYFTSPMGVVAAKRICLA